MKSQRKVRCVLVGTDSLRGKEIKAVLSRKKFPLAGFEFMDPDVQEEYSKLTEFRDEPKVIRPLDKNYFREADLIFLAADKKTNLECGTLASSHKVPTIDLSEAFNAREDIPLVVAGVNDAVVQAKRPGLIANPHPVTILLSHLFHPLVRERGLAKAIAFVLQPVSAYEESGIEELANQSAAVLGSTTLSKKVFKEQIAFNLLSHTEKSDKNGFSSTERQVLSETRRVLEMPDLPLSLSIIQAPVFHTYSVMTYFELAREMEIQDLESLYRRDRFFKVCPPLASCPVSAISTSGKEQIFIGQIKKEDLFPRSFWVWTVADNLTLGSALNAYEIAKIFCEAPPGRS
jgi:aspartate-semialdehyde dehydrogenase